MTSEFPPSTLRPLIHEVTTRLKERKETISVAETVSQSGCQQSEYIHQLTETMAMNDRQQEESSPRVSFPPPEHRPFTRVD